MFRHAKGNSMINFYLANSESCPIDSLLVNHMPLGDHSSKGDWNSGPEIYHKVASSTPFTIQFWTILSKGHST